MPMALTDFNVFLCNVEDLEDAYFLDQAIRTEGDFGYYDCRRSGNQLIISSDSWPDSLCLASDDAKEYFLDLLEKKWTIEKGMSIETSYNFKMANEKDD